MTEIALLTEDGLEVPRTTRWLWFNRRTWYERKEAPSDWRLDQGRFVATSSVRWDNVRWPDKPISHMRVFFPTGTIDAAIDPLPRLLRLGDSFELTNISLSVTPH